MPTECPRCDGSGEVKGVMPDTDGHGSDWIQCIACEGDGILKATFCLPCDGCGEEYYSDGNGDCGRPCRYCRHEEWLEAMSPTKRSTREDGK